MDMDVDVAMQLESCAKGVFWKVTIGTEDGISFKWLPKQALVFNPGVLSFYYKMASLFWKRGRVTHIIYLNVTYDLNPFNIKAVSWSYAYI